MRVGDLVYSKYPRIHGDAHGIILHYIKGSKDGFGRFFLAKVKVYWPITGKTDWIATHWLFPMEEA